MHKALLTYVTLVILGCYTHAGQQITRAPWMAIPSPLLCNLQALGMPLEFRVPHSLATAAWVGVLRRNTVWEHVTHRILDAADSDEATFNPQRALHGTSVVGVLRDTQSWADAQTEPIQIACRVQESRQVVKAPRGTQAEGRAASTNTSQAARSLEHRSSYRGYSSFWLCCRRCTPGRICCFDIAYSA